MPGKATPSLWSFILISSLLSAYVAGQDDLIGQNRIWKLRNGTVNLEGKLIKIEGDSVVIQRKNSTAKITVSMKELSDQDKQLLKVGGQGNTPNANPKPDVQEEIKNRSSNDTLESYFNELDPLFQEYETPVSSKETTIQTERRKKQALEKMSGVIKNKAFFVLVEVRDVRQAKIAYDFTTQLMMNNESPKQEAERLAYERSIFDIEISPKKYPIVIPSRLRCKIGRLGENIEVDSILRLDCITGDSDQQIGRLVLTRGDIRIECSITHVSIDKSDASRKYLANLQPVDANVRPAIDCLKITRRDFRRAFSKLHGSNVLAISVVDRNELSSLFGHPSKTREITAKTYWDYQCSDGVIRLEIPTFAQNGLDENQIMISSFIDVD